MSWNEEKVNKLKELWGKGNTASQIAEIIGGISRNAVIGKAHRLNLSSKIKTRNASSSQSFDNSSEENNSKQKQGRKSKFKSLLIEKNFEPGGKCSTQLKDMKNIIETAKTYKIHLPLSEKIKKLYEIIVKEGKSSLDHSALYLLIKKLKKHRI